MENAGKKVEYFRVSPIFRGQTTTPKKFWRTAFPHCKILARSLVENCRSGTRKMGFPLFPPSFPQAVRSDFPQSFFTPFWRSNGFFTFRKPVFTQFSGLFHSLLKTLWKPVGKRLEISLCLRSCGNMAGLMSGCLCRASFYRDTRRSCYALHYSALLNSQRSLASYLLARQGNRSRSAYGYPRFSARR